MTLFGVKPANGLSPMEPAELKMSLAKPRSSEQASMNYRLSLRSRICPTCGTAGWFGCERSLSSTPNSAVDERHTIFAHSHSCLDTMTECRIPSAVSISRISMGP